ncbi:MAG: GNAT family N-acetyltransferase [Chloroflexota bacterium]|nr:GNAT family N-acetyltransferase [Chloroflexota bacterium]
MQSAEAGPTSWYVRRYRPGDEAGLASLYAEAFGRERPVEVWRWKLMEREISPAAVWVAATHGDERIVGQYGGIPLRVRLRGEERPAVHAVEAMSARDFRRQGILTGLGEAAHSAWAAVGYAAVLGLPNEQWGTRNYALGYRRVFPLAWLRFPLHAEHAVGEGGVLPGPTGKAAAVVAGTGSFVWRSLFRSIMNSRTNRTGVSVYQASGPDDFDRLWSRVSGEYENVVARRAEWVDWRFTRAATYSYKVLVARKRGEPCGYIAYRLADRGARVNAYIADIFMARNDLATTAALLKCALDDLSARGASMVLATAAPGSTLYRQLRGLGFLPTRRGTAFNFEIVPLQPDVDIAGLSDPRTWHITAGDFDVV